MGDAPWWDEAVAVLSEDELLGPIVRAYTKPALAGQGNAFRSVVNAIVGQQISVAAADAIWGRLETMLGEVAKGAEALDKQVASAASAGLEAEALEPAKAVLSELYAVKRGMEGMMSAKK